MNYERIHDQIIDRAKTRISIEEVYVERHHIMPRSMGGSNSKENLILLTAREHYLIHWLLYKIHRNNKMANAWYIMHIASKNHKRYTSHTFERARVAMGNASSVRMKGVDHRGDKNPMFGKKHTEETRVKLSAGKSGDRNPMFGKVGHNKDKALRLN